MLISLPFPALISIALALLCLDWTLTIDSLSKVLGTQRRFSVNIYLEEQSFPRDFHNCTLTARGSSHALKHVRANFSVSHLISWRLPRKSTGEKPKVRYFFKYFNQRTFFQITMFHPDCGLSIFLGILVIFQGRRNNNMFLAIFPGHMARTQFFPFLFSCFSTFNPIPS